jgi:hypothetical protein
LYRPDGSKAFPSRAGSFTDQNSQLLLDFNAFVNQWTRR